MADAERLQAVTKAAQRAEALEAQFHRRRKDERSILNCPVVLITVSDEPIKAWAMDVAPRGLGVLLDRPLARGTLLTADLRSMGSPEYTFAVRVLYCHELAGKLHRCGMELVSP